MAMIEFEYEFTLPNQYCVDHEQTDGNKRTAVYDGPDKIYLIINNETGFEEMGPLNELEYLEDRPLPEGCRYVEVDALTHPVVCQLRAPIIDEAEEDYTGTASVPGIPTIEGYMPFDYQTPLLPRDVYDPLAVHVDENNNITLRKKTVCDALFGIDCPMPTYADVRRKRDQFIKNSDSEITEDMPADLKAMWQEYRQRVRDWPNVMEAQGVPPQFALCMEPIDPASLTPPPGEDDPEENRIPGV